MHLVLSYKHQVHEPAHTMPTTGAGTPAWTAAAISYNCVCQVSVYIIKLALCGEAYKQ